ncbi:hypothetical protein HXY32_08145 [Candidatus Bathyarchaeota archaeon]|nr:hypothetical protein [Candidatus Bathyarchaeota archaeon]
MSALKHGFFRRGFMLCDRCVLNGKCESFVPGGECGVEKQAYDGLVSELMRQYSLEGLADEILVGRVAMYLIRIVRAEVYEANVGFSDTFTICGRYIESLDKMLRGLLKDLALTRGERKKVEKGDVLVDVDRLLSGLARQSEVEARTVRVRRRSFVGLVMKEWADEKTRLLLSDRGGRSER